MLSLRRQGWTYLSLAFIYGVDHSSIYYECKKYGVKNPIQTIDFSPRTVVNILNIHPKKEKMYADYVKEAKLLSQRLSNIKYI